MTDYEVALSLLDSKKRYSESKVKSNPNLVNQILVQIWEDEIKNNFENVIKQLEELFQQFLKE